MSRHELERYRKLLERIIERVRFEGVISEKNALPDELVTALGNISYKDVAEPILSAALNDCIYFMKNMKSLRFSKEDHVKLLLFGLFLSQSPGFLQASVDAHVKTSEQLAAELAKEKTRRKR